MPKKLAISGNPLHFSLRMLVFLQKEGKHSLTQLFLDKKRYDLLLGVQLWASQNGIYFKWEKHPRKLTKNRLYTVVSKGESALQDTALCDLLDLEISRLMKL